MTDHYPYRLAARRGDLTLIWRPGEGDGPDELAVDELGGLLTFHDLGTLQAYCDRHGWELVRDGGTTLDLDAVRRWVERPDHVSPQPELLLDAWNFFEDLSHSVKSGPAFPRKDRSTTAPTRRSSAARLSNRRPAREPGRPRNQRRCATSSARG